MWLPGWPERRATHSFQLVRFEPVRSAEPPRNSGRDDASAWMAFWLALRVAMFSFFSTQEAIAAARAASNAAGRSPFIRRVNSAASAGNCALYDANSAFQSASRLAPAAFASQAAYT